MSIISTIQLSGKLMFDFTGLDKKQALCYVLFLFLLPAVVQLATKIIVSKTPKFSKEDNKIPIYHFVMFICTVVLVMCGGESVLTIQGVIFALILLYASICDIQTHEVKDFVSVMLVITSLIGANMYGLKDMLISGAVMFAFLFICAIVTKGKIGGADVKISAACALVLGDLSGCLVALIMGLSFSVIHYGISCYVMKQERDKMIPLVPYLSAGFFVNYLFLMLWR